MNPESAPNPQPPEALADLERGAPSNAAGGLPAVYHALRKTWGQPGPARGAAALSRLNQIGGFDCPSCAWPDPDGERSVAEFCENGAKAVASETTKRKIDASFFAEYSVNQLAEQSDYWLDQQGRLAEPMMLREGARHYEPIGWDEAFGKIGAALRALPDPNRAIFYTSGRASNEAAFLYQLFARALGTNNLPDCSNMCHESSGVAMNDSIGVGKGTVTLKDLQDAELILVIGQNPGTNHPRMLSTLQQAKRNGARIVSINPMKEAGLVAFSHPQNPAQLLGASTRLAETFIRVPANGDQALLRGVAKRLFEIENAGGRAVDTEFVRAYTSGFDEYKAACEETQWEEIVSKSGVARDEIESLAAFFANAERIVSCWAMGLTQHRNAVATIQELANLHLLRGAIGKPGAGLCPVRGHSNVQGDRTMGISERMPDAFLKRLDEIFGIRAPREEGFHTISAIHAMREGRADVFVALGGNFLSATPDTEYTASALRRCALTVQVSTKLNRSHLITGREALILPCLGRSERDEQASGAQWVSMENSMGIVHASTGRLEPASDRLKSEVAIVCGIARASLPPMAKLDWRAFEDNYSAVRSAIESVVSGFSDYEKRARQPGGFYLPNAAKERRFQTVTGKANFRVNELDVEQAQPGRLLLMTIRSHDQFNTTIYGLDDRYRGIKGERRIVFMNPDDMRARDIAAERIVDVTSYFRGELRRARRYRAVPYDLPAGVAAMYFPEANVLVPIDHLAKRSETPASKSVQVDVAPSGS